LLGDFEHRTHEITVPDGLADGTYEVVEGSYALGLTHDEKPAESKTDRALVLRAPSDGYVVGAGWKGPYEPGRMDEWFEETKKTKVNIVLSRMAVVTLVAPLTRRR
jgi:hypothetical protein